MTLRTVKPEIRIIGISSVAYEDFTKLIGVIYRGNKWVDGVISSKTSETELTIPLISLINNSNHYQQIRVITIHTDYLRNGAEIDLKQLLKGTGKPVIFFSEEKTDESFLFRGKNVRALGLSQKKAHEVLRTSVKDYKIPEALRVAGIIRERLQKLNILEDVEF